MRGFRLFLFLQVIFSVSGTTDVTTDSEEDQIFVSSTTDVATDSEHQTKAEVQRRNITKNEKFDCQKGSALPPFVLTLKCGVKYITYRHVLMISDHWVLGEATDLKITCKPYLLDNVCLIGRDLSFKTSTAICKEIVIDEKFEKFGNYKYNIAAISSEKPLHSSWSGPVPWPQRRGFTDECRELSVYFAEFPYWESTCETLKVLNIDKCSIPYHDNKGHLCAIQSHKDDSYVSEGLAVCNNVVVGVFSTRLEDKIFITKFEDYYTFIYETTKVQVPFLSEPPEEVTKKAEDLDKEENKRRPGIFGTGYEQLPEEVRSVVRKIAGKQARSSATSLMKPCPLFFFLILATLLLTVLFSN